MAAITALNQAGAFPAATTSLDPVVYAAINSLIANGNATGAGAATGTGSAVLQTAPTIASPVITGNTVNTASLDPSTVQILNVPLTLAQIIASNSVPIVIAGLTAKGAGTLIEIMTVMLDLIRGSAAFVGGGACALYYGTDSTGVIAQTAFAASVFTTFAASHCIIQPGALAVSASTAVLNTGMVFANPTADFTVGTGASGILRIAYRVHTGLS